MPPKLQPAKMADNRYQAAAVNIAEQIAAAFQQLQEKLQQQHANFMLQMQQQHADAMLQMQQPLRNSLHHSTLPHGSYNLIRMMPSLMLLVTPQTSPKPTTCTTRQTRTSYTLQLIWSTIPSVPFSCQLSAKPTKMISIQLRNWISPRLSSKHALA